MLSLVSSPRPSSPRRSGPFAPLAVLAAALLLYVGVWLLPGWLRPTVGGGTLAVLRVDPDGRLVPMEEGESVPGGTPVVFSVKVIRDASVVLVGLEGPARTVLISPITPPPRRLHPGPAALLPERWVLGKSSGSERFLAVLCNTPLPPVTVLKAAERALQAAGGDPARVHTLDLGCAEAWTSLQRN